MSCKNLCRSLLIAVVMSPDLRHRMIRYRCVIAEIMAATLESRLWIAHSDSVSTRGAIIRIDAIGSTGTVAETECTCPIGSQSEACGLRSGSGASSRMFSVAIFGDALFAVPTEMIVSWWDTRQRFLTPKIAASP